MEKNYTTLWIGNYTFESLTKLINDLTYKTKINSITWHVVSTDYSYTKFNYSNFDKHISINVIKYESESNEIRFEYLINNKVIAYVCTELENPIIQLDCLIDLYNELLNYYSLNIKNTIKKFINEDDKQNVYLKLN